MKFVGGRLTLSRSSEDGARHTVRIPIYHREAVGVFPGTQLFLNQYSNYERGPLP